MEFANLTTPELRSILKIYNISIPVGSTKDDLLRLVADVDMTKQPAKVQTCIKNLFIERGAPASGEIRKILKRRNVVVPYGAKRAQLIALYRNSTSPKRSTRSRSVSPRTPRRRASPLMLSPRRLSASPFVTPRTPTPSPFSYFQAPPQDLSRTPSRVLTPVRASPKRRSPAPKRVKKSKKTFLGRLFNRPSPATPIRPLLGSVSPAGRLPSRTPSPALGPLLGSVSPAGRLPSPTPSPYSYFQAPPQDSSRSPKRSASRARSPSPKKSWLSSFLSRLSG